MPETHFHSMAVVGGRDPFLSHGSNWRKGAGNPFPFYGSDWRKGAGNPFPFYGSNWRKSAGNPFHSMAEPYVAEPVPSV